MKQKKDTKNNKQPVVLGYSKVVKVDTVVRAGCSKSWTHSCGINWRTS